MVSEREREVTFFLHFYRFNAIIPFLVVIILTFVGMVLDGWWFIRENNKDDTKDELVLPPLSLPPSLSPSLPPLSPFPLIVFIYSSNRITLSVTNIFGNADAMAAVIWSTCLATLVLAIMLMIQKILSFSEVMTSWIEGVKDVIEPLFILVLAWALGSVITVSVYTVAAWISLSCHDTCTHVCFSVLTSISPPVTCYFVMLLQSTHVLLI